MEESVEAGLQTGKEEKSVTGRVEDRASSPSSVVEMEKITTGTNPSTERVSSKTSIIGRVPQWIKRVVTTVASGANRRPVLMLKHGKPEEAEEEASSSSWMQMVVEVNMLQKALIEKAGEAKKDPPRPWSTFSVELLKRLKSTNPYAQKAHRITGKESTKGVEGKGPSSSWVVEMEKILERTNPCLEIQEWRTPSVYRVPEWLRSTAKSQAYRPQVVSLGPFHHGEQQLKPMEEHKCRLMLHMVKRSKKPLPEFVKAVEAFADTLRLAYDGLDERWCGENTCRFVQMMVTDGGFLLEIMSAISRRTLDDYHAADDPIISIRGLLSLMPRIRSDMCLVENQLPLLVLQTLEGVRSGTSPSYMEINKLVADFLCPGLVKGISLEVGNLGLHPLDIYHKCFCGPTPTAEPHQDSDKCECASAMQHSAVELREAGVHIRKSSSLSIRDIDFQDDILRIPPVEVGDGTEKVFLNLIAFEQLHSNAGTDATDYMIFMDNIINSEKDVALLRSKGILKNSEQRQRGGKAVQHPVQGSNVEPRPCSFLLVLKFSPKNLAL
ncbi:hypothetical protein ACP70R_008239 [Stipagrostis hirtigluma subsp. patula]